jgi:hypothetical protein
MSEQNEIRRGFFVAATRVAVAADPIKRSDILSWTQAPSMRSASAFASSVSTHQSLVIMPTGLECMLVAHAK